MENTTSTLVGDPQQTTKSMFTKFLIIISMIAFSLTAFVFAYFLREGSSLAPKESNADTIIKVKKCKYNVECGEMGKCIENVCSEITDESQINKYNSPPKILSVLVTPDTVGLDETIVIQIVASDVDVDDYLSGSILITNPNGTSLGTTFLDSEILENGNYKFTKSIKNSKGSMAGKYEFSIKIKDNNRSSAGGNGSYVFN
ncbi:hypothetical protein KBD45_02380 [Candidatus Dojkabacteria bacterium]|nr:hypothetical protein [Candidatus Dojkabacteria bacterium]